VYDVGIVSQRVVTVTKDTVMPNGLQWALVDYGYPNYQRQVGDTVYRFNSFTQQEEMLFDFSRSPGDTVTTITRGRDTTDITLSSRDAIYRFGQLRRRWIFWINTRQVIDDERGYVIIDSIGVCEFDMASGSQTLQSAWIDGKFYQTTAVQPSGKSPANRLLLFQNFPNPFNPRTIIRFSTPSRGYPIIRVFNLLGQQVASIPIGFTEVGEHQFEFDGTGLSTGCYLYRLDLGTLSETRKLILQK
jgi:hypothetical protein